MLHMVELFLDPGALAQYARERGLTARELAADPAYAVHAWLDEALGPRVLRPFRVMQVAPRVRILGYSQEDADSLMQRMALNAAPSVARAMQGEIAAKKMPDAFPEGLVLAFELRLLATRKDRAGVEKDAFLVACDAAGDAPVDRFGVYAQMTADKLLPAGEVSGCSVVKFELGSVLRKQSSGEHGRPKRLLPRPQAVLRGELHVTSSDALRELLTRGVGRGSGLGFGMLTLRRAS